MKIVNSEIAMEAALERRYMERLRERVRSRVELEARLLRSVQQSHRDFADAVGAASSERSEAGRVAEIFVDSFEEQKIQREIDSQVDARLNAMSAYTGLDTQSPAVVGERLARGELRYEPETEARERFRAMARQAGRGVDRARMWSLDRDRYIDLQASAESTVEREQDDAALTLAAADAAHGQAADASDGHGEAPSAWPEDPREALPSGNLRTRDGQEIEASARQRRLAQRGDGPQTQRGATPLVRPPMSAQGDAQADDVDLLALGNHLVSTVGNHPDVVPSATVESPPILGTSVDSLRTRRVVGQSNGPSTMLGGLGPEQTVLWARAQQAYRQWH